MKKLEKKVQSTVNIAKLKNDLSKYLRLVKGGQEIIVTDHKMAIAKVIPFPTGEQIELISPTEDLSLMYMLSKKAPIMGEWSAVEMLIQERRKR